VKQDRAEHRALRLEIVRQCARGDSSFWHVNRRRERVYPTRLQRPHAP
jgi:hypothetical protein